LSIYRSDAEDKIVAVDDNHAQLVEALVTSHKPRRILELGFGAGGSCRAIQRGLAYNAIPYEFDLVDCWYDFNGNPPPEIQKDTYRGINVITATEESFVFSCKKKYDFIFSDADHFRTQEWFVHVYEKILNRNGIIIYHDVTNTRLFPNLLQIYEDVIRNGYHYMLFDRRSRKDEACERGLLVIFKH
jgi:predicted O-methyltransferase YrrM